MYGEDRRDERSTKCYVFSLIFFFLFFSVFLKFFSRFLLALFPRERVDLRGANALAEPAVKAFIRQCGRSLCLSHLEGCARARQIVRSNRTRVGSLGMRQRSSYDYGGARRCAKNVDPTWLRTRSPLVTKKRKETKKFKRARRPRRRFVYHCSF